MGCEGCKGQSSSPVAADSDRLERIEDRLSDISQVLACVIVGAAIALIVFGGRDRKDKD